MHTKTRLFSVIMLGGLMVLTHCSSDKDQDPEPDPPAELTISGTSPEYTFWGDELTIQGTGFSTVKEENIIKFTSYENFSNDGGTINPTSASGDIEITQATATALKIRVPYKRVDGVGGSNVFLGYNKVKIEVTVKDKTVATADYVNLVGLPYIHHFNYHYGWWDYNLVTKIGDSVAVKAGFSGTEIGKNDVASGYYNKFRLRIDGDDIPIKHRKFSGALQGWAMYMAVDRFANTSQENCDEIIYTGDRGRLMSFEVYVDGTDKKDSRELNVFYFPGYSVAGAEGPTVISLEETAQGNLNPTWKVTGKNMFHQWVTFTSQCGSPTIEIEIANPNTLHDEYVFHIPLVSLQEECTYTVQLKGVCDHVRALGTVRIEP